MRGLYTTLHRQDQMQSSRTWKTSATNRAFQLSELNNLLVLPYLLISYQLAEYAEACPKEKLEVSRHRIWKTTLQQSVPMCNTLREDNSQDVLSTLFLLHKTRGAWILLHFSNTYESSGTNINHTHIGNKLCNNFHVVFMLVTHVRNLRAGKMKCTTIFKYVIFHVRRLIGNTRSN